MTRAITIAICWLAPAAALRLVTTVGSYIATLATPLLATDNAIALKLLLGRAMGVR